MQQHVLDDGVGALAVLHDLVEVAVSMLRQLRDLAAERLAEAGLPSLAQFVDQVDGERGEVVDEVERVLDLVGDAGGELAERGELFGLDQPVCAVRRSSSEFASSRSAAWTSSNSRTFSTRSPPGRRRSAQVDLAFAESAGLGPRQDQDALDFAFPQHRHAKHRANPGSGPDGICNSGPPERPE